MAAFDRFDTHTDDAFALTELDSTGDPGEYVLSLPIEPETAALAVMIEGEVLETSVAIEGDTVPAEVPPEDSPATGTKLFFVVRRPWTRLRVRVTMMGQRAKVSILRVFRRFGQGFKRRLSCTACKRLVRFLLTWILTAFGVPHFLLAHTMPPLIWEKLRAFLSVYPGKLPPVVANLLSVLEAKFVDGVVSALEWALKFINEMYAPVDALLEAICRHLGFCEAPGTHA